MALASRGCWMLSAGRFARAAARSGGMPWIMATRSFRILRHVGRVAVVMGGSLPRRGCVALEARPIPYPFPRGFSQFVLRVPDDFGTIATPAMRLCCAGRLARVTYVCGESSTGASLRLPTLDQPPLARPLQDGRYALSRQAHAPGNFRLREPRFPHGYKAHRVPIRESCRDRVLPLLFGDHATSLQISRIGRQWVLTLAIHAFTIGASTFMRYTQ